MTVTLPVLTVRQPYASLIMTGAKDVENRTWPTDHRGLVAIHAGRQWHRTGRADCERLGLEVPDDLPLGAVLGVVELVDVVRGSSSPWAAVDHWHWILANPVPLARPVPMLGQLGLRALPAAMATRVRRALAV